jgi:hypothetical protein
MKILVKTETQKPLTEHIQLAELPQEETFISKIANNAKEELEPATLSLNTPQANTTTAIKTSEKDPSYSGS